MPADYQAARAAKSTTASQTGGGRGDVASRNPVRIQIKSGAGFRQKRRGYRDEVRSIETSRPTSIRPIILGLLQFWAKRCIRRVAPFADLRPQSRH